MTAISDTGWRSRGYLPHFDHPGLVQMITFRLADALPQSVLAELASEATGHASPTRRKQLEAFLDAGHGACHLRDPRVARLVENAPLHFDGTRYRLIAWVVMPNHVHVLIESFTGYPIGDVVQSWKSFTAKLANTLLGLAGRFWQPDYYDRAIRDRRHLGSVVEYIQQNPVRAGLVREAVDWPFSSARHWAEI